MGYMDPHMYVFCGFGDYMPYPTLPYLQILSHKILLQFTHPYMYSTQNLQLSICIYDKVRARIEYEIN